MFKFLIKEIFFHRVDFFTGILAVAVAMAGLLSVESLTSSSEKHIHDLAHELGNNMLVVPKDMDMSRFYLQDYDSSSMPDTMPKVLQESALGRDMRVIIPQLLSAMNIQGKSLVLAGVELPKNGNRRMWDSLPADSVILGNEASQKLMLGKGDTVMVSGRTLKVVGVAPPTGRGDERYVYTQLSTAQEIMGRPGAINTILLGGCWCRKNVPALALDVERLLPGTRAITISGLVKAQTGSVAVMKKYSGVFCLVSLLFSGAAVAALISSDIRRRMREIATLLAIGVSPRVVQTSYLLKATAMGLSGGMVGYGMGAALCPWLGSHFLDVPVTVSPGLVAIVLALGAVVSMVFSYLPALRASRLDPAIVLRREEQQ